MESVREFDLQEEPSGENLSNRQCSGHFQMTTSELNTLAMQQLLRVHETNQGPENVAPRKKGGQRKWNLAIDCCLGHVCTVRHQTANKHSKFLWQPMF